MSTTYNSIGLDYAEIRRPDLALAKLINSQIIDLLDKQSIDHGYRLIVAGI